MATISACPKPISSDDLFPRVRFRQLQRLANAESTPSCLYILLRGWVVSFRMLPDGRRQTIFFYLPGDVCGLHWLHGENAHQSMQAVTDVEAVELAPADLPPCINGPSGFWQLLTREMAMEAAIYAEHLVNLGRRSAAERLAHLLCEVHWRMDAAGLARDGECAMPFTQVDLADISGITAIHVNRVLQEMRCAELIDLKCRRLKILDHERLSRLAMFDERYLRGLTGKRLRDIIY